MVAFALRTSLQSVLVYLTYVQDWVWPARFLRMHIGTATEAMDGRDLRAYWSVGVPERAARMARLGSAACATWCERKAPWRALRRAKPGLRRMRLVRRGAARRRMCRHAGTLRPLTCTTSRMC